MVVVQTLCPTRQSSHLCLSSQQPWGVAQACLAAEEAAGVTK